MVYIWALLSPSTLQSSGLLQISYLRRYPIAFGHRLAAMLKDMRVLPLRDPQAECSTISIQLFVHLCFLAVVLDIDIVFGVVMSLGALKAEPCIRTAGPSRLRNRGVLRFVAGLKTARKVWSTPREHHVKPSLEQAKPATKDKVRPCDLPNPPNQWDESVACLAAKPSYVECILGIGG